MRKTVLVYGLALAAGAVALQWFEYQLWARARAGTLYVALIAARLGLSPNTVKTHVARLFEKLRVARRTEAISLARELGLVP